MTASAAPAVADRVRRTVVLATADEDHEVRTYLTTNLTPAPAELWTLLSRPDQLAQWYGPVEGDLREGGSFTSPGVVAQIRRVAAPHQLILGWGPDGGAGEVEIRLDPVDDGSTELQIVHTAQIPGDVFAQYGPGGWSLGWDIAILGLAAFSKGWDQGESTQVPLPGPAWFASAEGADYVRAWSIRWAAASIAAGTEVEAARAGEIATSAAYGAAELA